MKATIEFNLSEEDRTEFEEMLKAPDLVCVIKEFSNWLRELDKYGEDELIQIDTVREKLYECIHDNEVGSLIS